MGQHLLESLPAYLYGDLSGSERQEIAHHLRSCSSCSESLREFEGVRETLDAAAPPMPGRGDLAAQVMARARTSKQPTRSRATRTWAPVARAALVLMGIALGVGITWTLTPDPFTVPELEAMVGPATEDPIMAAALERQVSRRFGEVSRYKDALLPTLTVDHVMAVDQHFRTLVNLSSGESKMLAAYFQYRLGDYYATIVNDPNLALTEFLKVLEFVDEGKVFDLATKRIDMFLRAAPENR